MEQAKFFAEVATQLHSQASVGATVELIAQLGGEVLGCMDTGILKVGPHHKIQTLAATSDLVSTDVHAHLSTGESPSIDVISKSQPAISFDTSKDQTYPRWGRFVAELGLRSVLSVPLQTADHVYGSLNFYGVTINAFCQSDLHQVVLFARHAALAWDSVHKRTHLQLAVSAHEIVGQAQGILMERFEIDADRAFDYLRRQSEHRNIKLRKVAEWVVANRHEVSPPSAGGKPL